MKILFVILAHNQPSHVAELARVVTESATDAHAIIHFDANASNENFLRLENEVAEEKNVTLIKRRIACKWGDYSLVDAVLGGLREQKEQGNNYDYVVLLSGACLPCRPIKQLERFFEENYGREFIEAFDENWMISGLRKERYQFYWPFPPSQQPSKKSHYWTQLQRFLRIKRKAPLGMEVRFGSQWWALTWSTCTAMLDFLDKNPSVVDFFKKTYIPDEMMINTLVWKIAGWDKISGFGITQFQFTNKGKPTVFYDDHEDYPFSLNKFFYRKISEEAFALRGKSLAKAAEKDDGTDLSLIGLENKDYFVKVKAQTEFPVPGQIYYRDQYLDMKESVLKRNGQPYIFVCGPEEEVKRMLKLLDKDCFEIVGRIFSKYQIDWFDGRDNFSGLSRYDSDIRDMHPLLYLQRARSRSKKIPVFAWVAGDMKSPMDTVVYDGNACIITLPPMAAHSYQSRQMMSQEKAKKIPGVQQEYMDKVLFQMADADLIPELLASGIDKNHMHNIITCPVRSKTPKMHASAEAIFFASVENSSFQFDPWFQEVFDILMQEFSIVEAKEFLE